MSRFQIRPGHSDDLTRIVDGWQAGGGRHANGFAHRLTRGLFLNPFGHRSLVAIDPRGRVVAFIGVSHVPMVRNGLPVLFGRIQGAFVRPEYRVGGLHSVFFEMQEQLFAEIERVGDLDVVYGTFQEGDWWFLRSNCGFEPVSTGLVFLRPANPRPITGGRSSNLWRDLEHIHHVPVLSSACSPRADREFLLFRVHPDFGRREVYCTDDGAGSFVLAGVISNKRRRHLLDWHVTDGRAEAALKLLDAVTGDGTVPVSAAFWNPSPWTCHIFTEAGFHVAAADGPYLAARIFKPALKQHELSVHWQVTSADVGLSPQLQLGVDEEVTRPPQAGTRPTS